MASAAVSGIAGAGAVWRSTACAGPPPAIALARSTAAAAFSSRRPRWSDPPAPVPATPCRAEDRRDVVARQVGFTSNIMATVGNVQARRSSSPSPLLEAAAPVRAAVAAIAAQVRGARLCRGDLDARCRDIRLLVPRRVAARRGPWLEKSAMSPEGKQSQQSRLVLKSGDRDCIGRRRRNANRDVAARIGKSRGVLSSSRFRGPGMEGDFDVG